MCTINYVKTLMPAASKLLQRVQASASSSSSLTWHQHQPWLGWNKEPGDHITGIWGLHVAWRTQVIQHCFGLPCTVELKKITLLSCPLILDIVASISLTSSCGASLVTCWAVLVTILYWESITGPFCLISCNNFCDNNYAYRHATLFYMSFCKANFAGCTNIQTITKLLSFPSI